MTKLLLCQRNDATAVWVDNARLSLNPGKCKCMVISRKRAISSVTLTLGESTLEQVNTFKYLGIILSSNLSWTHHIEHTAAKAKKLISLLSGAHKRGAKERPTPHKAKHAMTNYGL